MQPERPRIMVVEDDPDVADVMAAALRAAEFDVAAVGSGEDALLMLERGLLNLVIMDQGLPGMSGSETSRAIRERRGSALPIIFVSGSAEVEDRIEGFASGADDYIAKPVDLRELVMRVRAVLRRVAVAGDSGEYAGPQGILLRNEARQVLVGPHELSLTATEFQVLCELLMHRGEVRTADAISLAVWGYETVGGRNYLEAQVSRVRGKLAAIGADDVIETVRGFGYVIR